MEMTLRPATPDDADAAIPLIYSSGPAVLDYIFTSRSKEDVFACMRRGFVRNAGELGYAIHTVAELDGKIVGIGAAFAGDTTLRFMVQGTANIFAHYGPLRAPGAIARALQVEKIVRPPSKHEHCIAHLGVSPEYRSKGIGARIVEHLLEEGRRLKRPAAVLDVSAENPRAQELYERLGFSVTRENASTLRNQHAAVPSHRRMELRL
ncbi:MAG: GNAT family N-acetyltransferase [Candidatus Hydrogenedentes bacterium]|nr:GNAT family N-acetyltransferase [Candidatus Hydrogenedentota bacterium]